MGVTKKLRFLAFLFLFIIFTKSVALAKTKVDILGNVMIQSGNGGKQVQDGSGNQDLTIYEPVLYIDSQITPNTNIFGSFLVDLWTSASEGIFDTNTGASGRSLNQSSTREDDDDDGGSSGGAASGSTNSKLQNRLAFTLGVAQKIGTFTLTPTFGYSNEFDYQSINGGFTLDKSFAQDNFILSAGYHIFLDTTHPYDAASSKFLSWKNKRTQSIDVSATQILSKSDLILLGYNYTNQSGFLAGSQNTIDLNGTRISEVMPGSRNRNAASLRYIHGFTDALALHMDYRFYFDDWGFKTHTIEPALAIGFNHDNGLVKLFYRFYIQNAAKYYQDSFPTRKTYMTSDSDLAKFTANEGGVMVSNEWNFKKDNFLKSINVHGGGLYYARSNNLHGEIFQLGVGGTF